MKPVRRRILDARIEALRDASIALLCASVLVFASACGRGRAAFAEPPAAAPAAAPDPAPLSVPEPASEPALAVAQPQPPAPPPPEPPRSAAAERPQPRHYPRPARPEPPAPVVEPEVEPEPEPEPEYLPRFVTLPPGTSLTLQLQDGVSAEENLAGDPLRAIVIEDVVLGDVAAIPAGSRVTGTLSEVVPRRKIGGRSVLVLVFDRLELASGSEAPIRATHRVEGRSDSGRDAGTIAGAAAGGALLGRVLKDRDRDRGALVGAILGAAAGTAIAAHTEREALVLPPGAELVVALDEPVEVVLESAASSRARERRRG
jgi:hypothetical protein